MTTNHQGATGMTTADAIRQYRNAAAALRAIQARQDAGIITGRNAGATRSARATHWDAQTAALQVLEAQGQYGLQGWLTEESKLRTRIRENQAAGLERPDLVQRLVAIRRTIEQERAL